MLNENIKYEIRENFIESENTVLDYVEELERLNIYSVEELEEIEEYLNNSCS